MKAKILGLLALGLLAGPMVVNAATVTWKITGVFGTGGSFVDPANNVPGCVTPGSSFDLFLSFNPSAVLRGQGAGAASGMRYRYDGSSLAMSLYSASCDSTFNPVNTGGVDGSNIVLFDNFANTGQLARDGLVFSMFDGSSDGGPPQNNVWYVQMAGTTLLDMFNGPGLPSSPDPRLVTGDRGHFVEFCTPYNVVIDSDQCTDTDVYGFFNNISSVPEPGTLALLGLGVAGLGMTRRRKKY
jgi:hypothetical protein